MKLLSKCKTALLVTVISISVLAGFFITGPNFLFKHKFYNNSEDRAQLIGVSQKIEEYYGYHNVYPNTEDGLRLLLCPEPHSKKPYCLSNIPLDSNGKEIQYRYPGDYNTSSYDLWIEYDDGNIRGNW